jgi:DNA polymerase I-like protein with 3'-5' exonuclease and polymerase domains
MSGRQFNIGVPLPTYIETDEQAQDLLHMCLRKLIEDPGDFIGFDTETHGKKMPFKVGNRNPLDWMSDTVVYWSLSFRYRGEAFRFCIPGEYLQYFAPLLENPKAWFACWNLKYDAHVSWNSGINVWNAQCVDGLALASLHDENRRLKSLKSCAPAWCGLNMTKYKDLFPTKDQYGRKIEEFEYSLVDLVEQGFRDQVSDYASYDAYCHLTAVEWVRDRLMEQLIEPGYSLWDYYLNMEKEMTEVLWRMERRGLYLDVDYLKSKIPEIDEEILSIEREVNNLACRPISVGSNQQLCKFFFGKKEEGGLGLKAVKLTKGGRASVDEEVLTLLNESGVEVAKKIVRHRSISKTKSTYLQLLINLAEFYGDRRIHPNFNQFGATTGRFSTDVPNSQNFPRADTDEFGIRKAFVAPPGHKLLIADYEQLEMRIMAHMARDKSMIRAIREGKDLHSFTVSRMVAGVTYEEVVAAKKQKEEDGEAKKLAKQNGTVFEPKLTDRQKWLLLMRQDNKAIGFGIIYGAGPPRVAQQIDIPEADIHKRIAKLERDEVTASIADRKKGRTLSGRVARAIKNNPLLSPEKAIVLVARQSIAAEKIQAYFDTFPGVHEYMQNIPEMCRESMEWTESYNGEERRLRSRPTDDNNQPIEDGQMYDWDMGWEDAPSWRPGQPQPLTRTGHEKKFGFVRTLCGRYRRLEDINHTNYRFKSEAERQSVNTTIQGSAADITKGAMLRIERSEELRAMGAQMLNQVHDELILQVPEENAEAALLIVLECMEHPFVRGKDPLLVPIPADGKAADTWAEK